MTVAFHTAVYYSPPTTLGLVPGRFVVRHTCGLCREFVATDLLIQHAQAHGETAVSQQPTVPA